MHRKQQKTLLFFIYIIINPATIKSCDRTKRLYAGRRTDSRAERRTELDDGFLASLQKEKLDQPRPGSVDNSRFLHPPQIAHVMDHHRSSLLLDIRKLFANFRNLCHAFVVDKCGIRCRQLFIMNVAAAAAEAGEAARPSSASLLFLCCSLTVATNSSHA